MGRGARAGAREREREREERHAGGGSVLPHQPPPPPHAQTEPSPLSPSIQAFIWQLAFATPATALPALERTLSLDDRVLRSVVLKRRAPVGPAPTPSAVARRARAALAGQAAGAALAGHEGPGGRRQ